MKKLMKRLKNNKGESLIESLASILILTMASIILFSMTSSASSINATVKAEDEKFQTRQAVIEGERGGDPKTFTFKDGTGRELGTATLDVISEDGITVVVPPAKEG